MATQAQKEEVLFETKQINSLKMKRNSYSLNSKKRKALQNIISAAEDMLKKKRAKWGV